MWAGINNEAAFKTEGRTVERLLIVGGVPKVISSTTALTAASGPADCVGLLS